MNTRLLATSAETPTSAITLKPFASIKKMIAHVLPFGERMIISKGDVVHYYHGDIRQALILLNGSVALHRRGDGMVFNSESSPFLLGVSSQFSSEHLYLRALETSEVARLSLDDFNQTIARENLWEDFSRLLVYSASRVFEHCAMISQLSAYDIIRFQLVELLQEPDSVRHHITAATYIKSRTYLSRSGIMRILAELRIGGYIILQRGILLDITHLPQKY